MSDQISRFGVGCQWMRATVVAVVRWICPVLVCTEQHQRPCKVSLGWLRSGLSTLRTVWPLPSKNEDLAALRRRKTMTVSSRGQALEQSNGRIQPGALLGSIHSNTVKEEKQQYRDEGHAPAEKRKMSIRNFRRRILATNVSS